MGVGPQRFSGEMDYYCLLGVEGKPAATAPGCELVQHFLENFKDGAGQDGRAVIGKRIAEDAVFIYNLYCWVEGNSPEFGRENNPLGKTHGHSS